MAVFHYLKDGTRVDSVEGLVVKYEDNPQVYRIMDAINKRLAKEKQLAPITKEEELDEH